MTNKQKQKVLAILDAFWDQVCGLEEGRRVAATMFTWVEAKTFNDGCATGIGIWGSNRIEWVMDFGKQFDSLILNCTCNVMKKISREKHTAPCPHTLRALLQLEAKLRVQTFEEIQSMRYRSIVPF